MAQSTDFGKRRAEDKIKKTNETDETDEKESAMEELKKKLPSVGDAISVVAALAIAAIFFFLFLYFFRGIEYYWLRGVAAVAVTFLCLGAISAAIKTPTNLAVPVVIAVFFFFFFAVIKHYADQPKEEDSQEIVRSQTKPTIPEIQTLDIGSHSFFLKAGEELGPLKVVDNLKFIWSIRSSLDKNYWTISLNNGTPLDGLTMSALPLFDSSTSLVVKATKDQTVTIDIVAE